MDDIAAPDIAKNSRVLIGFSATECESEHLIVLWSSSQFN